MEFGCSLCSCLLLFLEFVFSGCYGLVCLSRMEFGIPGCYGIAFGLYVVSDSQLNHRDFG